MDDFSVRIVRTGRDFILYLNGRRYDHSNGQPFAFATFHGALDTAVDEWEIAQSGADEVDADLVAAERREEPAR